MELHGVHHVSLSVRDVDASCAGYEAVLGLHVLFRDESEERRAAVMRFPSGAYAVGLTEHRGNVADFDPRRTGLDHLAFTVASEDDLNAWARRLGDAGVDPSGVVSIPPGAILNFKDPDGIALALFWDRP
jgi:glyoxylase I family protein